MVYLITHGERYFEADPRMRPEGRAQINKLESLLPDSISLVVIGTGKRFYQTYTALCSKLAGVPVKFSPFCGSANSLGPEDNQIILAFGGHIPYDDYLGLSHTKAFKAWKFVAGLPDNALLCAGGELMTALGLGNITEKGQLFELDPVNKTGKKIS